jgi:hypothetical protein
MHHVVSRFQARTLLLCFDEILRYSLGDFTDEKLQRVSQQGKDVRSAKKIRLFIGRLFGQATNVRSVTGNSDVPSLACCVLERICMMELLSATKLHENTKSET